MIEHELETIPSAQLFQLCAEHLDEGGNWAEFVRRYNSLLARSVHQTYRRFTSHEQLPMITPADILQEVYVELLRNGGHALRQFRGTTEEEAQAYLAHIAIYVALRRLRQEQTFKRQTGWLRLDGEFKEKCRIALEEEPPDALTERTLIDLICRTFTAPNCQRDILLFLLHVCDGFTARELAETHICDLKSSSIANLLIRMKKKLKKSFSQ